jgi:rhamnosyltransferase
MTVQDARPANDQWLERMLQHFDDPNVAGVCGQQAVAHEAQNNPLQWFRPCSEPTARKVWFADPVAFERLTPAEQVALCRWDDVTAMYRRSTLLELPFQRVSFAEDMIWAKGALLRGRALVYEYSARVYHYHSQSFRFRFRRVFTIKYHLHAYFSHVATPNWLLPKLARCVYWSAQPKYCPERRVNWCAHNVSLLLADWLAGWCFWFAWKGGGQKFVNRAHARLCAQPPQPVKAA